MLGLLFILSGTFFEEFGTVIGKKEVMERKESVFTMGFLNMVWAALVFIFIAFFIKKSFIFAPAALPTFLIRAVLEIAQAHISILAVIKADRSAFGFIRTGTIPLILLVDLLLGYAVAPVQILGIIVIVLALIILFSNHGLRTAGLGLVLFTTVNAAATISLYKYNITNFNSVEVEQSLMMVILLAYMLIMAKVFAKENPIRFLKQPIFLLQSLARGVGSVAISFAYIFAPASIIVAAKRAFEVFWSIVSGKVYFREKQLALKLFSFLLIAAGLAFMVM